MSWRKQHPDFDNGPLFNWLLYQARAAVPACLDTSWRNDTCPSIGFHTPDGECVQLFVDYKDLWRREVAEVPTMSLSVHENCSSNWEDNMTESPREALRMYLEVIRGVSKTV